MTALAAARLGYRCHIYAPAAGGPAALVSAAETAAAYDDWPPSKPSRPRSMW